MLAIAIVASSLVLAQPESGSSFVNWENPHVSPLAMTPDGKTLLAVNTPDNRLEVFDLTSGLPVWAASIPVGLDPVSVRARTSTEVWVVNHISDSVSIVDLSTMNVRFTLRTDDEPTDVVFAGSPERAFVSCSQVNRVMVFDPANLSALPVSIEIDGEDPRAMAVSPDGTKVYVAIFESGNASTVLGGGIAGATLAYPPNVVSHAAGPYAGKNPPPNDGPNFNPPIAPGNGNGLPVSLIVKKNLAGQWMDDNNGNWTSLVSGAQANLSGRLTGWDLPDHDVGVIDASSLGITYARGLMNANMALAVNPSNGRLAVVGTDARNEVRYEPVINGTFLRVNVALVNPANLADKSIKDLNAHLTYGAPTLPTQAERDLAIGDPRGIAFDPLGTRAFVTGMGSNNVVVLNSSGERAGLGPTIPVGEGPTGIVFDAARARVYVLNKFSASLSVIDAPSETVVASVPLFDPTPAAIKIGRKHLYNTHKTSGLGYTSCASCHIDARFDRLAWDLGDPEGAAKGLGGLNLGANIPGLAPPLANPAFQPFHAMKGPMTTQTLQDIVGHEPHHWRGDRLGLEEFNPAFMGLLGDDEPLSPQEMQEFEDFLASIHFPPNPFRNLDNSLPSSLPLPGHFRSGRFGGAGLPLPVGNAEAGLTLYRSQARRLDGNAFACVTCHTLPTGAGTDFKLVGGTFQPEPVGPNGERHHAVVSVDGTTNVTTKTPQLRNLYDKVGFEATKLSNRSGFGFLHDGSVDSLARFVSEPVFTVANDQEVANLVAFLLAFSGSDLPVVPPNVVLEPPGSPSKDAHAAVGVQTTVVNGLAIPLPQLTLLNQMRLLADSGKVAMVVKGRVSGASRGYAYLPGGTLQSDRTGETIGFDAMLVLASPGAELTFTIVPAGSRDRIGIDRDLDGYLDGDEIDVCANPADPNSFPGAPGNPDCEGDLDLDIFDYLCFLGKFSTQDPYADFEGDGDWDLFDFLAFQDAYAGCQ